MVAGDVVVVVEGNVRMHTKADLGRALSGFRPCDDNVHTVAAKTSIAIVEERRWMTVATARMIDGCLELLDFWKWCFSCRAADLALHLEGFPRSCTVRVTLTRIMAPGMAHV